MGESLFGEENDSLEEVVIREGALRNKTVASAESCTGGLIAHRLTNVAGSSAVFLRGWVTYSNEAKTEELGVPAELIAAHGAVSEEVVRAMVLGALERSGADVAVATTGIAGPGGGTPEKPVGLIWMAWARRMVDGVEVEAVQRNLVRQREPFKLQASQLALDGLRRRLKGL
jgi:nicotinamide-nucleotide amidase